MDRAKREIALSEKNIIIQQITVAEFELQAQKIERQLEALSFMHRGEMFSRLQEYAEALGQELKDMEEQIGRRKRSIEIGRHLLEDARRQLMVREEEHRRWLSSMNRHHSPSPKDQRRQEIRQQNIRMQEEATEREKQGLLQTLRILEGSRNPVPSRPLRRNSILPSARSLADEAEFALCERLEKRVEEEGYDIAEINLLVAEGLPGAENLDIERTLKTLDLWAAWVKHETDRHLYRFKQNPDDYSDSEAYFRVLMLVCVLQQDFKVCYHKDPKMRAGPVEVVPDDFTFFANSQDLFVHGLTAEEHQGTCASLPVLYVAVGRRLGYPLKLVTCKGHLFARWEDDRERFNIEGTNRGLNCYPDEEYMEWPWPISKEELDTGMYMKSLSPKRELAEFLELRSLCLKEHGFERRHLTVKYHADRLRKQAGVDLDKLTQIMRASVQKHSDDGTVASALLYQVLTNTNSWRAPDNKRGGHGRHSVFATDRFDLE